MIPWWSTDFGEADITRVSAAIRSKHISQGPVTKAFEERLGEVLKVPYVVCTTSGTTSLTMALMAAGVGAGDEVIVPNRTWIATVHAVMMTGAEVKLVDVDERGLLPNVSRETTSIPVHLNGRFAGIPWVGETCIEDSCQNFPEPPCVSSIAACYSFSTAKLLPTGQGGAVATRDEGFYLELLALRTHDVQNAMNPIPVTWKRFGYNFRYNDILASIGLAQLETLQDRIERLHEIRALYSQLPAYLELLPCDGVPLYTEVLCADSERLRLYLLTHGIQARPNHPSLHSAPYLRPPHKTAYHDYEFPNSKRFESGLTLPSGPAQTDENIKLVIECLHDYKQ
jgi:dTDP-4-amino-4,6-dideoxygalactose transaminase